MQFREAEDERGNKKYLVFLPLINIINVILFTKIIFKV